MSDTIRQAVLARLSRMPGPDGKGDLVSLGLLSDVFVSDGRVAFSITVPADKAARLEPFRREVEKAVAAVPGVERAMIALTAEKAPGKPGAPPARPAAPGGAPARTSVPGVAHVVAVASGKGGVGKSTVSVNLALALHALGLRVGILDADIYGPSIPRLLGVSGKPALGENRKMIPHIAHGIKAMSMGFLVDDDTPMVWRGPMLVSALRQMLFDCAWAPLDVLIIDMPPGTGDVQLSLSQTIALDGAVIVSTPQDLALLDARKGLEMFRKVEVPILGLVENMSTFVCPHCGGRSDVFGHGGVRREAEKLDLPFLGEIPLALVVREKSDAGTPVVVSDPTGAPALAFRDLARGVQAAISGAPQRRPAPRIIIES
ncbi:Mrp/NBP35 family ATP-binding protein [Segnochrobactraceae bacterium EtOH-i3]